MTRRSPAFRSPAAERLPAFPWDSLAEATQRAAAHPDGMINLSVGTPVDDVPPNVQLALAEAAWQPGYPPTEGSAELRGAIVAAMARRFGVTGLSEDAVVPVIGTKEEIASLPMDLGIHADSLVVIPELAYPTYEVSAKLAGCRVLRADSLLKLGPETPALIYLNSPANPHGAVLGVEHLRKVVDFARQRDCIVVSDECYLGLGWEATEVADAPVSILDPRVCDGDHRNLIAVHSLSKTSNMASYRAGWLAGDRQLMAEILGIRKHAGGMVPGPIQHAMIAALSSDDFETLQRQRYRERREVLLAGLDAAGFTVEHSEAGLYIWATEGRDAWETVGRFAELGILVAPGHFYGPAGAQHVRVGLTASDEQIAKAAQRLAELGSGVL